LKTIAILGPTASGKTALAVDLALTYHAYILSLDSLSLYKEIDIASAKPSLHERCGIPHFGIDVIYPNEHFNVTMFFNLYTESRQKAEQENKNLIIVGGTGFYLKAMMEGISLKPPLSLHVKEQIATFLLNLEASYALIQEHDKVYAAKIASNDRYRIEKWLEFFLSSHTIPSHYLAQAKQEPILKDVHLFEIDSPKEYLAQRIALRTKGMIKQGLIDEVFSLEKRYSRTPSCMKAIGIKEVLDYYDGKLKLLELEERITINTVHLAKRQRTFNASQFPPHLKGDIPSLLGAIEAYFKS